MGMFLSRVLTAFPQEFPGPQAAEVPFPHLAWEARALFSVLAPGQSVPSECSKTQASGTGGLQSARSTPGHWYL